MTMTFASFSVYELREQRKLKTQQVLVNLAIALICADTTFLAGIEETNTMGCRLVSIFLHYFLLVAFASMLLETIVQYH